MPARKLKFINDPGHGWLSVSLKDIIDLDIVDKISAYSYMSPSRAYLEEDCDASIFINAAKDAGWKLEIKESYSDNSWKGRNWPSYNIYFVKNPLITGSKVKLNDGSIATFYDDPEKPYLITESGQRYKARKANALQALNPPV